MEVEERINLALEIAGYRKLVERGINIDTNIKEICSHYGVSRTTGYQVSGKLEDNSLKIFSPDWEDKKSELAKQDYLLTLLSINSQTLRFLGQHASEIHQGKYMSYSEEVKAGIIKQMRDAKEEHGVKYEDFIKACGLIDSTVMRWNTEYDADMKRKKETCELRGKKLSISSCAMNGIIEAWDKYNGRKITEFCGWYNQTHPFLSRDVITEVLIGAGRYRPGRKRDKGVAWGVRKYYPNAQWSWDGKEIKIVFNGKVYKFNLEVTIDLFSGSILCSKISRSEDEEAVLSTVKEAIDREGSPIAGLYDNGKANLSERVRKLLEEEDIVSTIAYPYRAQTKGDLEGLFGHLERVVEKIEIRGETEEEMAGSVAEVITQVYGAMYNNAPKKVLDGKTPTKVLREHPITEEDRVEARESLLSQVRRSKEIREKREISQEKEWLIDRVMEKNSLCGDKLLAQKVLRHYDSIAIDKADNNFYIYSQREEFDENKRNLGYFRGIVRKIQEEIDFERLKEYMREKYFDREKWRAEQEELRRKKEEQERKERLIKEPEKELLKWVECKMNLPDKMKVSPVEEGMEEAVKAIYAHKRQPERLLRKVLDDIGCDLRYGMAKRAIAVERIKGIEKEVVVAG